MILGEKEIEVGRMMDDKVSRRTFIGGAAAAGLGGASTGFGATTITALAKSVFSSPKFPGETLRIATYGGTYGNAFDQAFGKPFEALTGAKIQYVAGNPGNFSTKILAAQGGDPGFDVADLDDSEFFQLEPQGLLEKIDTSSMPHLKGVFPAAAMGKGYTPALTWYNLALGYNAQKLQSVGVPDPTSWNALWDPRLAGKVAVPAVAVSMAIPTLVMANLLAGGKGEANLNAGFKKLGKLKVNQVYQSSTAVEPQVIDGSVWIYLTTPSRIYELHLENFPIKVAYPKIHGKAGVLTRSSGMQIIKGTSVNKKLAEAFIDYHFRPDAVATLTKLTGVVPTVVKTVEMLQKDPKYAGLFITPSQAKTLYVPNVKDIVRQLPMITQRWSSTFHQ